MTPMRESSEAAMTRLVHFKELYTEVPGPHSLDDDLDEWKDSLPETKLVTQLKQPEIESSIEDIVRTNAWLDRVHESIFKRTGTRSIALTCSVIG
jgi:hypothetical protein